MRHTKPGSQTAVQQPSVLSGGLELQLDDHVLLHDSGQGTGLGSLGAAASTELQRQAALARYDLPSPAPLEEQAFRRLVELAARLFEVQSVLISFLGDGLQWVGASCGSADLTLPPEGIEVSQGLCQTVIQSGEYFCLPDATVSEQYRDHPFVTRMGARFYAGMPLRTPEGYTIGTLCLLDRRPHAPLSPTQLQTLTDLAALTMDQLELRLLASRSEQRVSGSERLAGSLRESLAHSETLQAISELGDLGLSLDELLLRATALCAAACDVELGCLVAIYNDRAFLFPAWHAPQAADLAAQVARGLRRDDCEHLWSAALAGATVPVLLNDYGAVPGAHPVFVQGGVQSQAAVLVGQRGEVRFLMMLNRIQPDRPWRPHQQQLISAAARAMRDQSLQYAQREALVASNAELTLALESAPLVLFRVDRDGIFQQMRGSGIGASGWSEFVGRSVDTALAGSPQTLKNLHRAMAGESFDAVVQVGERTFDVRYVHVQTAQGEPDGALGVCYDVTGRVRSQRQMEQARSRAEGLLQLAQTVAGNVLDPEVAAAALDALLQVLAGGWAVLWELRGETYRPVSQRGEVPERLRRLHARGLHFSMYDELIGVVDRNAYLSSRDLTPALNDAGTRGLAALPLLVRDGRCVVGLTAYASRPFNPAEREVLETAASIFGAAVERHQHLRDLEDDVSDTLTGVGNRRALNAALARSLEVAAQSGSGLCVVSVDVHGLRTVNRLQGPTGGSAFLSRSAAELQAALPAQGELYRLGGDEFVAIYPLPGPVPETPRPGPDDIDLQWVDRAVQGLRRAGFPDSDVSAGYARFPLDASTAPDLLHVSDERLQTREGHAGAGS